MDIDQLQQRRMELVARTDQREAAGDDPNSLQAEYEELEQIDFQLWEHDFGESLNHLCAMPSPQDIQPPTLSI